MSPQNGTPGKTSSAEIHINNRTVLEFEGDGILPERRWQSVTTLDPNNPRPTSLEKPEEFSDRVDRFARVSLDQVRGHSSLAFHPDPEMTFGQQARDLGWESLIDPEICGALALQARNNAKRRLMIALRSIQGWAAQCQPTAGVTENRKRQAIVPAAPQVLSLTEEVQRVIETAAGPGWANSNGPTQAFRSALTLGTLLGPEFSIPAPARLNEASDYLLVEAHATVAALQCIEGIFGKFDVWTRDPDLALLESLLKAMQRNDHDEVDYWQWLFRSREIHPPSYCKGRGGKTSREEIFVQCGRLALIDATSSWRNSPKPLVAWYGAARNIFIHEEFPRGTCALRRRRVSGGSRRRRVSGGSKATIRCTDDGYGVPTELRFDLPEPRASVLDLDALSPDELDEVEGEAVMTTALEILEWKSKLPVWLTV